MALAKLARAPCGGLLANAVFPTVFVRLLDGSRAIAWGIAVVERGHVGLSDLVVAPERRGCGVGRRLSETLLAWGCGRGRNARLSAGPRRQCDSAAPV